MFSRTFHWQNSYIFRTQFDSWLCYINNHFMVPGNFSVAIIKRGRCWFRSRAKDPANAFHFLSKWPCWLFFKQLLKARWQTQIFNYGSGVLWLRCANTAHKKKMELRREGKKKKERIPSLHLYRTTRLPKLKKKKSNIKYNSINHQDLFFPSIL